MPALNIATDTAKANASQPQQWSPFGSRSLAGHRITQLAGRQVQVTTDDSFRNHAVDSTYAYMLPTANALGNENTKKAS
jgi:hypothetical protein